MALLRMLAFRPADADGAPSTPLKNLGISRATADSTNNPVAGAAIAAPVVQSAPVAAPPKVEVPAPAPVEPAPVAVAAAPQPAAVAPAVAEKINPPWEESAPVEPAVTAEPVAAPQPVIAAPSEPPVIQSAEVSEPVDHPAASEAQVLDVETDADDDDDEPPPADEYYEVDGEAFDYLESLGDEPADDSATSAQSLADVQPATGLAAEWLELFPRLGLSGLTGSIGANCSLVAVEGDVWRVHLEPTQSALFNANQQRRLNDALNQYLGRTLKLEVEISKPEQETPAQMAARKRAERQRLAEVAIQTDPLVQQMIQQFAAVIRDGTIEPLETQNTEVTP